MKTMKERVEVAGAWVVAMDWMMIYICLVLANR